MRNYIKMTNHPNKKTGIQALEKLAIDTPEVCIMDPLILPSLADLGLRSKGGEISGTPTNETISLNAKIVDYFRQYKEIDPKRCANILSKDTRQLGDYDFMFEWHIEPSEGEVQNLYENIKQVLVPLGIDYTITTKE